MDIFCELRRRVDLQGDSSQVYHVFMDVSESEAATLYAIGSIQCQDMLICNRCLECLGKRYKENGGRAALSS